MSHPRDFSRFAWADWERQNNAGALFEFDQSKTLRERLHATYEVNVLGAHILTEALKPLLEKAEFPRIVNISSYLGSNGYILTPNQKYPFFAAPVRPSSFNTAAWCADGGVGLQYVEDGAERPHGTLCADVSEEPHDFTMPWVQLHQLEWV